MVRLTFCTVEKRAPPAKGPTLSSLSSTRYGGTTWPRCILYSHVVYGWPVNTGELRVCKKANWGGTEELRPRSVEYRAVLLGAPCKPYVARRRSSKWYQFASVPQCRDCSFGVFASLQMNKKKWINKLRTRLHLVELSFVGTKLPKEEAHFFLVVSVSVYFVPVQLKTWQTQKV